jgi:transcriptional regulator with XRE-family HTH domain
MGKAESRGRTSFGQRMHQARKRLGLTQMQVCEALSSITQGAISECETSASSSRRTAEFARLYRCSSHWLSTGKGSPGWDEREDALAQENLERDALRALRALPLDQWIQAVAELVAKAEMHRYIHRHEAAPEPRELEPGD